MKILIVFMMLITVVGHVLTVNLTTVSSTNDSENVTLVCNTDGKDLTFTFKSNSSDSSVSIAECVLLIQNCFLMNSIHTGTYAIKHMNNGGSLTILSLNKVLYGTYTCLETYDPAQKASVEIDLKTDEYSHNASVVIPDVNPNDAVVEVSDTPRIVAITCGILIPTVVLVVLILLGWRRGWLKQFKSVRLNLTFLQQKDRGGTSTNEHKKDRDEESPFINQGSGATESVVEITNEVAGTSVHVRADQKSAHEHRSGATDSDAGMAMDRSEASKNDENGTDEEMETPKITKGSGSTESVVEITNDGGRTRTNVRADQNGSDEEMATTFIPNSGATESAVEKTMDKTETRTHIPDDENGEEQIGTPIITQYNDATESDVEKAIEDNLSAALTQNILTQETNTKSDSSDDEFHDAPDKL